MLNDCRTARPQYCLRIFVFTGFYCVISQCTAFISCLFYLSQPVFHTILFATLIYILDQRNVAGRAMCSCPCRYVESELISVSPVFLIGANCTTERVKPQVAASFSSLATWWISEKGIFIARRQVRGSPGYHPNQKPDYPSVRAVRLVLPVSPVRPAPPINPIPPLRPVKPVGPVISMWPVSPTRPVPQDRYVPLIP